MHIPGTARQCRCAAKQSPTWMEIAHLHCVPRSAAHVSSGRTPCSQRRHFLSETRITSFNPDHTSLTAQTLISTKPSGRAISRIVSSVISVGTLDAFFGHETHTKPSCFNSVRNLESVASRKALSVANTCAASSGLPAFVVNTMPSGKSPSHDLYSFGALIVNNLSGALIPSFFTSGVPE